MHSLTVGSYERQVDCTVQQENFRKKEKYKREINFAFLPERYEPLIEDDDAWGRKEESKRKKREKYKKVKKNVRKALRYSWKCLMLGLQSFSVGYATPVSAVVTLVPEYQPGKGSG
ncbi:required for drug-induced death protein 1-like [Aplochiton taeniatus]